MLRMTVDAAAYLNARSQLWMEALRHGAWETHLQAVDRAKAKWDVYFQGLEVYSNSWNRVWSAFGQSLLEHSQCLFRSRQKPDEASWRHAFEQLVILSAQHHREGFPDRLLYCDLIQAMDATAAQLAELGAPWASAASGETIAVYFDVTLDYATMVTIPARGGSKGVPRKALQPLGGEPLLAHTIRAALAIRGVDRVIVNTDDAEIRDAAIAHGAEAPFLRPAELAGDASDLSDALNWQHEWHREHENFIAHAHIIMSPTNPFRRAGLVDQAIALALADPAVRFVRSAIPVAVNPGNFWTSNGGAPHPFRLEETGGAFMRNSFSFFIDFSQRMSLGHLQSKHLLFPINALESIDIDEPKDLTLARMAVAQEMA